MKRAFSLLLCLALTLSLAGCARTYNGTDELIEKAREEIPISDAATVGMQFAGGYVQNKKALFWFISGNEQQAHYYLPMEVEIKREDQYKFVRTYEPLDDSPKDIAALLWNNSYVFLINNPACTAVRITDENGTYEETIEADAYPYVFSCSSKPEFSPIPTDYVFLDADGNELG